MCRIIVSRCKFAKLQVVHEENNNNTKIQFNDNSGPGLWQQATKQRKNPPSSSPGSGSEVLLNNPRNSNLNINSSASEWKTHCIRKTAIFNNAWLAWHEPEQLAASITMLNETRYNQDPKMGRSGSPYTASGIWDVALCNHSPGTVSRSQSTSGG